MNGKDHARWAWSSWFLRDRLSGRMFHGHARGCDEEPLELLSGGRPVPRIHVAHPSCLVDRRLPIEYTVSIWKHP